jgi:hypothetical protein
MREEADRYTTDITLPDRPVYTSQISRTDPGSYPPEVSNLPYLVYYYYSIYRDESVNGSADGAYTPMRIGIPARNLYRWGPYLATSIKMFNCMAH